jgi:hypothetical protein
MTNLGNIYGLLTEPFSTSVVEVKPGATNQEGTKALALAYVDARHYQARLDDTVGADNWQVEYRPVSDRATVCRLTIFGVVREDVGEADATDANQATSAAMQAFKRACAAFGLGRYLYTDLPQLWVDAEKFGKTVKIKDPAGAVWRMYQQAGILGVQKPQTNGTDRRQKMITKIQTLMVDARERGIEVKHKPLDQATDDELVSIGKAYTAALEKRGKVEEAEIPL